MTNWIAVQLKEAGYKMTEPRKRIVEWIFNKKGIFSVSEVLKSLSDMDKVSIYRNIEILTALDIIHPALTVHGEQHYELHEKKHHHHMVCMECEKTACVDCTFKEKVVRGFTDIHHSLSLTGLCTDCAK